MQGLPIDKRLGERTVIDSRPEVEVQYRRRAGVRTKTHRIAGRLVQVSITGALIVTSEPMPGVRVGNVIDLVVKGRHSMVAVRRIDEHHDMTLYGVEYAAIDAWLQALIDRAAEHDRSNAAAAPNQSRP